MDLAEIRYSKGTSEQMMRGASDLMDAYNQSLESVVVRSFDSGYSKKLQSFSQRVSNGLTSVQKLFTEAFETCKLEQRNREIQKDEVISMLKQKISDMNADFE